MNFEIVVSGNIDATAAPCLEFCAYLHGFQRADEGTRTPGLLITSLLEHALARPTASGNCAYLCGFRYFWQGCLSTAYQRVSARLQYRCSNNLQ